jgi:hypothetical protein
LRGGISELLAGNAPNGSRNALSASEPKPHN